MRIKICGMTQPSQADAIAKLGATELGFICVASSPRYVTPEVIQSVVAALPHPAPNRIGIFANAAIADILAVLEIANLSGIQLHGGESPAFCEQLRASISDRPDVEIIKAFRVRSLEQLAQTQDYADLVDTLLLDAFHPQQLGGTGQTLDWQLLRNFKPSRPWFLAGGLNPDNVQLALSLVHPDGIDLSSGVERSPGDKDLEKVKSLFDNLKAILQ